MNHNFSGGEIKRSELPQLLARQPDLALLDEPESGVEMPHEAAVGKIDQREIEYLMARGLDEESAISTIIRGFLNVGIEGLPAGLRKKLDKVISETQKDMM